MKYANSKGADISVFSLGTVQLGRDYGLGEHTAMPERTYALSVLNCASEHGINVLDTANNYGESEAVIGQWLKSAGKEKRPMIVTKIGPFDHSSDAVLENDIHAQTKKCMETLGVDQIDILMVHDYEDYEQNPEIIKKVFHDMKNSGKIRFTGISVYSYHDYEFIASSGFDSVQIPLNIFDWSKIDNGGIKALHDAGMMIFTRSVFMQGLVFLKPEDIDPQMDFCVPYVRKYHEFCKEFNLSPGALAVSFVLSVPGITSLVLGCQTIEQVINNCETVSNARKLTPNEMEKLHSAFCHTDPRVTNPMCWFNHF